MYIHYSFFIANSPKTNINCEFKVEGYLVSDDGIVDDLRTAFCITTNYNRSLILLV